uniref:Uncharacterized protein n=1 Tax=Parascaris equorum TaxID=6256 RepID=A0A914SGF8_PAREQ
MYMKSHTMYIYMHTYVKVLQHITHLMPFTHTIGGVKRDSVDIQRNNRGSRHELSIGHSPTVATMFASSASAMNFERTNIWTQPRAQRCPNDGTCLHGASMISTWPYVCRKRASWN